MYALPVFASELFCNNIPLLLYCGEQISIVFSAEREGIHFQTEHYPSFGKHVCHDVTMVL